MIGTIDRLSTFVNLKSLSGRKGRGPNGIIANRSDGKADQNNGFRGFLGTSMILCYSALC